MFVWQFLVFLYFVFCWSNKIFRVTTQSNILCKQLTVGWPTINPNSRLRQSLGQIHFPFRTNTFPILDKYISHFGQIHFSICTNTFFRQILFSFRTNTFPILDKYIFQTNTFLILDKYSSKFGQMHFPENTVPNLDKYMCTIQTNTVISSASCCCSQKIYVLYGLKRTNIEDRASQTMDAGGWVLQLFPVFISWEKTSALYSQLLECTIPLLTGLRTPWSPSQKSGSPLATTCTSLATLLYLGWGYQPTTRPEGLPTRSRAPTGPKTSSLNIFICCLYISRVVRENQCGRTGGSLHPPAVQPDTREGNLKTGRRRKNIGFLDMNILFASNWRLKKAI